MLLLLPVDWHYEWDETDLIIEGIATSWLSPLVGRKSLVDETDLIIEGIATSCQKTCPHTHHRDETDLIIEGIATTRHMN